MTIDRPEEFSLQRVLPEKVSEHWEFFAPTIERSLPPVVLNGRKRMGNVLRSILMDELVVWMYGNKKGVKFIVSTVERVEPVSLTKDLLIYSFTGFGEVTSVDLTDGLELLSRFGKSRECLSLVAYVDNSRIKQFLESKGAKSDYFLIQIPLL